MPFVTALFGPPGLLRMPLTCAGQECNRAHDALLPSASTVCLIPQVVFGRCNLLTGVGVLRVDQPIDLLKPAQRCEVCVGRQPMA